MNISLIYNAFWYLFWGLVQIAEHFKKEVKSQLCARSNWLQLGLQYLCYKSVNCGMRQNKQCAFKGRIKIFSSNQNWQNQYVLQQFHSEHTLSTDFFLCMTSTKFYCTWLHFDYLNFKKNFKHLHMSIDKKQSCRRCLSLHVFIVLWVSYIHVKSQKEFTEASLQKSLWESFPNRCTNTYQFWPKEATAHLKISASISLHTLRFLEFISQGM